MATLLSISLFISPTHRLRLTRTELALDVVGKSGKDRQPKQSEQT
jgi:hypothetical protein